MSRISTAVAVLVGTALAVAAPAASAVTSTQDIGSPSGPLTHVYIGADLACQVSHEGDTSFEFYPPSTTPGDCGTMVATGGTLYAPDFGNHGGSAASSRVNNGTYTPYTQSGTIRRSATNTATTTVGLGSSGLQITETDLYTEGNEFYRTNLQISNSTASPITATVYHAVDCYLQGSDTGYGFFDSAASGIYCSKNPNNSPSGRVEGFVPITSGSNYVESNFSTVWSEVVAGGTQFPNTCACTSSLDNGAGLSWPVTVPGNGSITISFLSQLSPSGTVVQPNAPIATTGSASNVTQTSATLNGSVNPNGQSTSYHFEYGTSTSYGSSTPAQNAGSDSTAHPESANIAGLQPNTTYHFRIVASSTGGASHGGDATFKTGGTPPPPPPGGPEPHAGRNSTATATGDVTVKCPGGTGHKLSSKESSIPNGCLVNATNGTVNLNWKDNCPGTGHGRFGGEPFIVTQPKDPKPVCDNGLLTTLDVKAPDPTGCDDTDNTDARRASTSGVFRALSHRRRTRSRHHHSGGSVHGTQWRVEELCEGTLTTVIKGIVDVRDFTLHKTVSVPAGHSYLARAPGGGGKDDEDPQPGLHFAR